MKNKKRYPPRIAKWLFNRMNRYQESYSITCEVDEVFQLILSQKGYLAASLWYWHQAIASYFKYTFSSFHRSATMFKNYFKVAFRNIKRNKSFTFINISGLVAGIVSVVFILLYVQYELSYDNYLENADNIFRVELERKYPDERIRIIGGQSTALTTILEETLPEIEHATSVVTHYVENTMITYRNQSLSEDRVFLADEEFFNVFPVKLIKGDPERVLAEPNSVVITEAMAEKYFGPEEPVGRILKVRNNWLNDIDCVVTGVSQDLPPNSHFHYDFIISLNSTRLISLETIFSGWYSLIYLRLQEGVDPEEFGYKFSGFLEDLYAPMIQENYNMTLDEYYALGNRYNYFVRPVKDIHLRSNIEEEIEPGGDIIYVYLYSVISAVILLIACINFINLSTAKSVTRAKEVGVRKTFGAFRKDLIKQFLFESVNLSLISLILALIVVKLLFPIFKAFTGIGIDLNFFSNVYFIPALIIIFTIVGLLSGSYPAFFLSSFKPVSTFKGRLGKINSKSAMRNCLVVFQFIFSISLIAGTMIINDQITFMLNKDIGYDKENVIVLENGSALGTQLDAFKTELQRYPGIVSVAASIEYPGTSKHYISIRQTDDKGERIITVFNTGIESDLIETLGMEIIQGRNFTPTDSNAIIINRTLAEALGVDDPVGRKIEQLRDRYVVGVVEDFNYASLHNEIKPFLFGNRRALTNCTYVVIRIGKENVSETIGYIENKWREITGNAEFGYTFLDKRVESLYVNEEKTKQVSGIFSFLAIMIGSLGLFGLVAFSTEQRTREIGVRKVLGASVNSLLFLLIRDLIMLIGIAFVVAVPVTYYLMQDWLQNFVYRIDLRFEVFLFAGILVFLIAVATVIYQAVKAAIANPVDSLRYE